MHRCPRLKNQLAPAICIIFDLGKTFQKSHFYGSQARCIMCKGHVLCRVNLWMRISGFERGTGSVRQFVRRASR